MALKFASAGHDERGQYTGGVAGDQTGDEVTIQNMYMHTKGWTCLRAKSAAKRAKIAQCAKGLCANDKFGYDQSQRNTGFEACKKVGWDPLKVTTPCEIDCSMSVRICCNAAGIPVGEFYTGNEVSILKSTGEFEEPFKVTKLSELKEGDILCTNTKGHTVVVVDDAVSSSATTAPAYTETPVALDSTGLTVLSNVNIRKGPGTSYAAAGSYTKGQKIKPTSRTTVDGVGWFKTDKGWVSGKYLAGWIKDPNGKWWYLEDKISYAWPTLDFKTISGKTYAFGADGYMLTSTSFNTDGSLK